MKIENFQCAKNRRFLCMKFPRKAQAEIIGLVIVIILMIIGMFFALRFMSGPVDYKKQFAQAEISSNTINALLKTASKDCNGLSMTELLQNCAENPNTVCGNQNSCDYFIETTQQIFGQTLEKWNVDYEFKVFYSEEDSIFNLGEACSGDKKSRLFPIPTASGNLFVRLNICS